MLIVVTILIYRAERHQVFSGTVAAFPAGGVGAEAGTGPGGPRIGSMCDRDRWRRDPGTLPMSRRAPGPHPKPSATSVCVITDPLGPRDAWGGGEEQNMRLPRPSTFAFVLTLDMFEFRASTTTTGWTVFRPTTRPVPPWAAVAAWAIADSTGMRPFCPRPLSAQREATNPGSIGKTMSTSTPKTRTTTPTPFLCTPPRPPRPTTSTTCTNTNTTFTTATTTSAASIETTITTTTSTKTTPTP